MSGATDPTNHINSFLAAFKQLWDTVQAGKDWTGIVKNLRKDGKYYWVHSFVSPIVKDGAITGYSAARRHATKLEIEEAKENYNLP